MLSTIRAQHIAASLAAAGATLLAGLVGLAGLAGVSGRMAGITARDWPTADMCMEYWIGSLSRERAQSLFAEGDEERALVEAAWARGFVANSLSRLREAGALPAETLDEMSRLDRKADGALQDFFDAVRRERGLEARDAALPAVRRERHDAERALDLTLREIEALITPVEDAVDREMDRAAAEGSAIVRRTWNAILAVVAASMAGAVLVSAAMTRRIVSPLRRLSEVAGRFAEGRLDERAGIRRQDEIGHLAERFDAMAAELASSRDALKASEARYRTLFEYARHGIAVLDGPGAVLEANNAFAEMVGCPRESIAGRGFGEFLPDRAVEGLEARLGSLISSGSSHVPLDLLSCSGALVPTEAGAVSLPDGRTVLSLRDVTQRRRMEQALIQGEKLSAIGQLAAGVAHELRNPLFVISNVLYDLRDTLGADRGDGAEGLDIAAEETRRAREIIDNLLEFARPVDSGHCWVQTVPAIEQVLRLFQESLRHRRIELATRFAECRSCFFHPDAFKQVLVNLLSNAMDAMPEGGRLSVATATTPEGRVEVRVEDTGEGIPPERQKEIFNPFYSTKPPGRGTGLGLWLVHSAVERYEGRIQVESAVGKGTCFRLQLSAAGPEAT